MSCPVSPHPNPLPEGEGARGGLKPTLRLAVLVLAVTIAGGCIPKDSELGRLDKVFGRHGISDGRFQKPRAMTIDAQDRLYVCDMTARIQVFDADGNFLRVWQTPAQEAGRPTGLSIGIDGNLLVADTHYYRVLIYSPQGRLLRIMGGAKGERPGQFGLVTSAVQDRQGNYYVADYGDCDRIQKFAPDGRSPLGQWGRHGEAPGEFSRPQKLALDEQQHLWVCDACNHRIQVFDREGKLLSIWGRQGGGRGELYFPYDLILVPGGLWVAEFGNNRIQKFTRDGRPLGFWGSPGREEGQLFNPWAIVRDSRQRIFVFDTGNHRVQRVTL